MRSLLYTLARLLGDANAVSKGPAAVAKRIVRKAAWRSFGSIMNKVIK